jgi:flavorubredoxin
MKNALPIIEDIYWIGVNDYETPLFEALWPLPYGVTYNSYLIMDEKVALMDTVKQNTGDVFRDKVSDILENGKKIDYLIIHHMEPDHSGSIISMIKTFPDMKIVGNKKTIEFVKDFYGITDNVIEIKDGDTLDLGKHKLKFILTPMVHWPETMLSYDLTSKALFTGDVFGGFGTLNGGIFDDEIDLSFYTEEIRRYFSNIIGKYSKMVQKALSKIKDLDIGVIAPTHGPIYRKNPQYITDLYDKWSRHETEEGVVIAYGSMYGNTQIMAEAVARSLAENGIKKIKLYNVSKTDVSYIINDIWKYKGIILGTCTYNMTIFPKMNNLVCLLDNKKLENRYIGVFGSYSWSGGGLKGLKKYVDESNLDYVEPSFQVKSHPTQEDLDKCYELGKNMAEKINNS